MMGYSWWQEADQAGGLWITDSIHSIDFNLPKHLSVHKTRAVLIFYEPPCRHLYAPISSFCAIGRATAANYTGSRVWTV